MKTRILLAIVQMVGLGLLQAQSASADDRIQVTGGLDDFTYSAISTETPGKAMIAVNITKDMSDECKDTTLYTEVDNDASTHSHRFVSLLRLAKMTERKVIFYANREDCLDDGPGFVRFDEVQVLREGAGRGLTLFPRQTYAAPAPKPPPPPVPPTTYVRVSSYSNLGVCGPGTYATGCISGERRIPASNNVGYRFGTWGGYSVLGNQIWSYRGNIYCYYGNQKRDYDRTDLLVGLRCAPSGSRMSVHYRPYRPPAENWR